MRDHGIFPSWSIASLLALALTGSGCSFLFVKGAPREVEAATPLQCTESRTLPWVDTGFAVGSVLAAVGALTTPATAPCTGDRTGCEIVKGYVGAFAALAALAIAVPTAIVTGASAGYGFAKTSRCREAVARQGLASPIPGSAGASSAGGTGGAGPPALPSPGAVVTGDTTPGTSSR
jgi:hypothetical protein